MLHLINSSYFRSLLDSFPEAVIIFNAGGLAYAANAAAEGLVQRPLDQWSGQHHTQLLRELDDPGAFDSFMADAEAGQPGQRGMSATFQAPGGPVHLSLTTSLLIENDKIFGVMLSLTDISHIVELHQREKRILEERNALQRERVQALRTLAQAVAHQIRNPVMAMAGMASLLQRGMKPGDDRTEYLEAIREGCKRLEAIVSAVGSYTAVRPGETRPVDMAAMAAAALDRARQRAPGSDAVRCVTDLDGCRAIADANLVEAIMVELVANALEALGQGPGEVRILGRILDKDCLVEVADNGPGLSAQDAPFVFDPFFSTKALSVGMGLTSARRMADEMGGGLDLRPGPERGATAVLRLPAAEGQTR